MRAGFGRNADYHLIPGQRINHLTLLKSFGGFEEGGLKYWNCECVCGEFLVISDNKLKRNARSSCGCMRFKKDTLTVKERADVDKLNAKLKAQGKNFRSRK